MGCSDEHPIFFELLLTRSIEAGSEPAKRGVANIRADVPGGRVRRIVGRVLADPNQREGRDYRMAKKAKGAKKKAAKKR